MKCLNYNLPSIKKLIDAMGSEPLVSKLLDSFSEDKIPTVEEMREVYNKRPEIQYTLKAVETLQSTKAKEVFAKGNKNNWSLEKILTELSIPKNQQALINKDLKNPEEIATDLLANYSYTVEINTATTKLRDFSDQYEFTQEELENGTKESDVTPERNTKHYANMTVAGGTNYTENEFKTPLITPSIKGHAQFSTSNGIGWFRSDEAVTNGKWYQGGVFEGEMIASSTEGGTPTKTRRILEVQSDLFQKGRDKEDLITNTGEFHAGRAFELNGFTYNATGPKAFKAKEGVYTDISEQEFQNAKRELESKFSTKKSTPENQFLQLLNKDNNWVTFFIKSIIQDSAKKGYEKVLFPTGNTASKVEGHQTLEDFKKQKEEQLKQIKYRLKQREEWKEAAKVGKIKKDVEEGKGFYYFYYGDQRMLAGATSDGEEYYRNLIAKEQERYIEQEKREENQLKEELKRIETEGFASLKPIFKFYEEVIYNILKKIDGVSKITDEYGNTWYEIPLNDNKVKKATTYIQLQKSKKLEAGQKERPTDFKTTVEKKSEELQKIFKGVGIDVEISVNPDIAGEAHVVYESGSKKAYIELQSIFGSDSDKVEHEFGHIYVDLIGLENPIMKRFWKQIQTDNQDVLNHVKEYYPEYDESSDMFKKEVMTTVIGEEAVKQTPVKLSKLQVILNQIYRYIAGLFGKEPSIGKELARQMISGQLIVREGATLAGTGGEQRSNKRRISPEEFVTQTYTNLKDKVTELSKGITPTTGYKTLQEYKSLLETLETLSDLERLPLINNFITEQISKIRAAVVTRKNLDGAFLRNSFDFVDIYRNIENITGHQGTEFEDIVKKMKKNDSDINELENLLLKANEDYTLNFLKPYVSNPESLEDLRSILSSERDLAFTGRWVGTMDSSPLPLFQLIDKFYKTSTGTAKLEGLRKNDELVALQKELPNWDFLLETDENDERTGRVIREFSPEYYAQEQELNDKIHAYESSVNPDDHKIAEEWKRKRVDFYRNNTHQATNEKFQEIYKILDKNPQAREQRETLNKAFNRILKKAGVTKYRSEFNPNLLTPDDYDQLIHLKEAKENLSSLIDSETGLPKTGEALEIAKIVREFNQAIGKAYDSKLLKSKKEAFELAKQAAKDTGEEYYQKWAQINTIREIAPIWYEEVKKAFEALEETEKSEISAINEQIRELSKDYRMKGGFVRAKMLYERNPELFKKIQDLEKKKENILKEKAKNSSKYLRPFEIPDEYNIAGNKEYFAQIEKAKKTLTPRAKKWKDEFKAAIVTVLSKYVKPGEKTFNAYEVTPEDLSKLLEIKRVYKSRVGSGLEVDELDEDQESIKKYNLILHDLSEFVDNKELRDKFTEDRRIAIDRGEGYLNLWDAWFAGDKDNIFDPLSGEETTAVSNGYTVSIPLRGYIDKKKTQAYKELNRLSTRVNSPEYEKAYQEAKKGSESDFNEWYKNNHYFDPIQGKETPYYIWTQTLPKDQKYIEHEAPSNHWRESDIKEEFKNPDFEKNINIDSDPDNPKGNPLDKYKSKKYEEIMNLPDTDVRKRILQWYRSTMNTITENMGHSILDEGFIPHIYAGKDKSFMENLKDIPTGLIKTHISEFDKYQLKNGLRLAIPYVQRYQKEYIKKNKETGQVEDTPEEVLRKLKVNREFNRKNINYDLPHVMSEFIQPIYKYNAKNSIINELLLAERLFLEKADISQGNGIRQLISRKTLIATGRKESPFVSVNPEESQLYERLKDWFSQVFYEEGMVPLHSKTPNKDGYVIDYNKIVQNLNKYTALRALAVNFYAGVSNVTLGALQLKMEASSRLFFNNKNLRSGWAFYTKNVPLLISDSLNLSDRHSTAGKAMKLFSWEDSEAGRGYFIDEFGKFSAKGTLNNSLMFIMRSGDFALHTALVGAMLDANTVENGKIVRITKPKEQKPIRVMFEEKDKDGKLSAVQLKDSLGVTDEEFSKFKYKALYVFKLNNGNYSPEDKVAAKKYAISSMAMMFRNFIVPGFERRFQGDKAIEIAETRTIGYYRATWQFLGKIMKDLAHLRTGLIMQQWETMPEYQKGAIRATLTETATLMSVILLTMLLTSMSSDDGEKDSWWHGMALYQLQRLRSDILFYHPEGLVTGDVLKIIRSPFVSLSTIEDTGTFLLTLGQYPFQSPEERVYHSGPNKDKYKVAHEFGKLVPVANQITRLKDPNSIANFYRIFTVGKQ